MRMFFKRLTGVETNPERSHQHEIQGVKGLRELFGETTEKNIIDAELYYLSDDEDPFQDIVKLTWYNARKGKPRAAEYRLYYPGESEVMARAKEGDLLAIGVKKSEEGVYHAKLFVIESGSRYERRIMKCLPEDDKQRLTALKKGVFLEITPEYLLEEYDVEPIYEFSETEIQDIVEKICDEIISEIRITEDLFKEDEKFRRMPQKSDFIPPQKVLFEKCINRVLKRFNIKEDPDRFVELCFSLCEKVYVALEYQYLREILKVDVNTPEEFIKLAHSVLNARRSRAGNVLENLIEILFQEYKIIYVRKPRLPSGSSPDFVVPDVEKPRAVISVKTTLKERWRQIFQEASSLSDVEHFLITCDRNLSEKLLSSLKAAEIRPVVPRPSDESIFTIADFLEHLKNKLKE